MDWKEKKKNSRVFLHSPEWGDSHEIGHEAALNFTVRWSHHLHLNSLPCVIVPVLVWSPMYMSVEKGLHFFSFFFFYYTFLLWFLFASLFVFSWHHCVCTDEVIPVCLITCSLLWGIELGQCVFMHKASLHTVNYDAVCLLLPRPIISWSKYSTVFTRLCKAASDDWWRLVCTFLLVDQQHFKLIVLLLCSSYDLLEKATCILSFIVFFPPFFVPLFETDVVGWLSSSALGNFGMYCAYFLPLSMEGRNVTLF